jgi:hypothetical protein
LYHTTDFNRKGLNDLPLLGGLCLVPMMELKQWVSGYKQEQAKGNSGADKISRECITLMKVEDFLLDAWWTLGLC